MSIRFALSDIDLTPTDAMARNAARGLELREKHGRGGTAVGVARARDIKNRASLSPETVRRMNSFFARHAGNEAGGEDDAGYIAFMLWGGAAGRDWAERKSRQIEKATSAAANARAGDSNNTKARNMRNGTKAAFGYDPNRVADNLTPEQRAIAGQYRRAMYKLAAAASSLASDLRGISDLAEKHADQITREGVVMREHKQNMDELLRAAESASKLLRIKLSRPGAKAAFAANSREVAQTILQQLGGGRFVAMTGARNPLATTVGGKPGLQIDIGRGAQNGINRLIVLLDEGRDTYEMQFWKIGKGGMNTTKVAEYSDVYADNLRDLFTHQTKFLTRLSRPGAKAKFSAWELRNLIAPLRTADAQRDTRQMEILLRRVIAICKAGAVEFPRAAWAYEDAKEWAMESLRNLQSDGDSSLGHGDAARNLDNAVGRIMSVVRMSRPGAKAEFTDWAYTRAAFLRALDYALTATVKGDMSAAEGHYREATRMMLHTPELNNAGSATRERWIEVGDRMRKARASRPGAKAAFAADDAVSRKISTLVREGYKRDQAVAIAYDLKRRGEL